MAYFEHGAGDGDGDSDDDGDYGVLSVANFSSFSSLSLSVSLRSAAWFITCQLNSFTLTRLSCRFPATNINKTDNTNDNRC